MFYLGIDIGKNTHVASLVDDKKKVIFKAFSFSNSIDGAESLILKLEAFKNELEVGMEATGHYWLSLYSYLVEKNFTVRVINPIQTDGWRQGADLLRYGDFVETSLSNEDYLSLRNLSRFRSYLISSIGDLKRKTIALLDQVFPVQYASFSNIFGKTSKEILSNFSTPSDFEDIKRFSNPSKLVAYAGLDASVSQSGEYESTYNHMSKRGSPYLRRALFQSALRAEFCDPVFSAYYQKKITEGKHHLVATNAVARKLWHTIFAVLTKNEPYQAQS